MELRITPEDLYAASAALTRCVSSLDEAADRFTIAAHASIPGLGLKAMVAAIPGAAATERAVHLIASDIGHLASALADLAERYPQVDATAVSAR